MFVKSKLGLFGIVHIRRAPQTLGNGTGARPQSRLQIRAVDILRPQGRLTANYQLGLFTCARKIGHGLDLIESIPLLVAIGDKVDVPGRGENGLIAVRCDVTQILVPFLVLRQNGRVLPYLNHRRFVKLEIL